MLVMLGSSHVQPCHALTSFAAMVASHTPKHCDTFPPHLESSLEDLNQILGEFSESGADGADAEIEQKICSVLTSSDATTSLLYRETAEHAGLFARRSTLHVLKGAASGRPRLQQALSSFFVSVANLGDQLPMTAALVLGGALLAFRQGSERALPADIVSALQLVQYWLAGEALEAVVVALMQRSHVFLPQVADATSGWLCGLQDYLAVACTKVLPVPSGRDFAQWLDSSYLSRLAEAQRFSMCSEPHAFENFESKPWCWDFLGRMSLRNASALAAAFCKAAFNSIDDAVMLGKSISKLAEQSPPASRALVCAILCEAESFFKQSSCGIFSRVPEGVARLSALLHPSLGAGLPVQQLLAVQIWQTRRGSELACPVVFALVDTLHAAGATCWWEAYSHWLEVWADPSYFQSSDIVAERSLALRLARAVRRHIPDQDPIPGQSSKCFLQGIHLRLSAQTRERRLYGMAVAELLAECRGFATDEGRTQLRFDGFDRRAGSL